MTGSAVVRYPGVGGNRLPIRAVTQYQRRSFLGNPKSTYVGHFKSRGTKYGYVIGGKYHQARMPGYQTRSFKKVIHRAYPTQARVTTIHYSKIVGGSALRVAGIEAAVAGSIALSALAFNSLEKHKKSKARGARQRQQTLARAASRPHGQIATTQSVGNNHKRTYWARDSHGHFS